MSEIARLHWGCGTVTPAGWVNSDQWEQPGVDVCADILDGMPLADDSFDYIVSNHALQELEIYDEEAAFAELRRVLKPGGVLRVCLPDLDRAIAAYLARDGDFFIVREWETVAGNFITQVIWHGYNKTPFTYEFAEELARKAGFARVERSGYRETASPFPEIVDLDTRRDESFYLEAWK